MKILEQENFEDLIKEDLCLVDFYADWCGPCKALSPILEELTSIISIIKVNIETHSDLANKYKIMSIPTLLIFKKGELEKEVVGFHSKEELIKIIEEIK